MVFLWAQKRLILLSKLYIMNWLENLFFSTSTAHSILIIVLTIAIGIVCARIRFKGVSLGIAWILFAGICLSHFGMRLDSEVEHFVKEFGLILFVYSIGLQVGPGFFSSLCRGGLSLNLLAAAVVFLGCGTTYVIHLVTGEDLATMIGILSGAVTNTPSLGAAQQAFTDVTGGNPSSLALGYAVAYPLGVIGIIATMITLRIVFSRRIKYNGIKSNTEEVQNIICLDVKVTNERIIGRQIKDVMGLLNREFVVSRIIHSTNVAAVAMGDTVICEGDILRIVAKPDAVDAISTFMGEAVLVDREQEQEEENLVSRRIVVTRESVNGSNIGSLNIRSLYEVNITRINRSGVDLIAVNDLRLQIGDRVTVVGSEKNISKVVDILGNSMKRLDHPNLFPIVIGIFLGILLGSIPFMFPGIPQPVKLGLAGGPLIVAILVSRFGPYYKLVTFTTTSANMMLREMGIALFLAAVGLGAGGQFIETITNGGYWWVVYGVIITLVPILIVGVVALFVLKIDGGTLMGLLAGSTTDPPALAYANSTSSDDKASVSYATVYPLTMFLRVLTAQILMLIAVS